MTERCLSDRSSLFCSSRWSARPAVAVLGASARARVAVRRRSAVRGVCPSAAAARAGRATAPAISSARTMGATRRRLPPTAGWTAGSTAAGRQTYRARCRSIPDLPGVIPGFAFTGGRCASVNFSSCQGNENRFYTLEECLVACEGRPVPNGCPAGRLAKEICLQCSSGRRLLETETVCAQRLRCRRGTVPARRRSARI